MKWSIVIAFLLLGVWAYETSCFEVDKKSSKSASTPEESSEMEAQSDYGSAPSDLYDPDETAAEDSSLADDDDDDVNGDVTDQEKRMFYAASPWSRTPLGKRKFWAGAAGKRKFWAGSAGKRKFWAGSAGKRKFWAGSAGKRKFWGGPGMKRKFWMGPRNKKNGEEQKRKFWGRPMKKFEA